MDLVVFWLVAPISLAAAILMLLQRNAVHAALLLVLNQFTLALFFVLLGAHFLAAVQVIVYAGAIMVLFLFVVMFLGVDRREALVETIRGQRLLAVTLGVVLVAAVGTTIALGVGFGGPEVPPLPAERDNVTAVGRALFTDFVFPFEVTSILLIVAAIAAMVMTRRRVPEPPEGAGAPVELEQGPGEPAATLPGEHRPRRGRTGRERVR